MTLLYEIEQYLARNNISPSTLGKHAINDKAFVTRLRCGAAVRDGTVERVRKYMSDYPDGGAAAKVKQRTYRSAGGVGRVQERIDLSGIARVDSRPCWNCGAAYARCGCHGASA